MSDIKVKTPWTEFVGDVPLHLEYFDGTMYEAVEKAAKEFPHKIALDFMGRSITYSKMLENIEKCAKSLKTLGVREGDCVTIALPNCPQGIYMFYAVNLIGAIANMIHPLAAEKEIEFYVNESHSTVAVTLDQFYGKFEQVRSNTNLENIIIASVKDELSEPVKAGYMITEGYKIQPIPYDAPVVMWKKFLKLGRFCSYNYKVKRTADDNAVILYSGGTTGVTKGVLLSNKNFNSAAEQIIASNSMFRPGDKMLAALPLFHGFGLGVCVHSMLTHGGRCVLVPRFTASTYAKLITQYKCNYIAGVPTLFDAIVNLPSMKRANLSSLKGVFSGGDNLSVELKKKIDRFLEDHGCAVHVREGYGAAECVTACCLTPPHMHKEGSIGVPFPDTYFKIVKPGTDEELSYGETGEILISGPSVMNGYLNHPDETEKALRTHDDGLTWLYTGDLGMMDEDGFIFFKGRAKRMIISSGYNIYPAQIENILDGHDYVQRSCVIGVPDEHKMQKIKAFVVLNAGITANQQAKDELLAYCRKRIAKYSMPYDIEFRDELPLTGIGKVAYRELENEEASKANDSL